MKILITGGTGMVGSAFKNIETEHELILVGSKNYDLLWLEDVEKMLHEQQPDGIIHLAARVGGVKGNSDYVADFFHENILINTNLLTIARRNSISKVVSLLSTCIYPERRATPKQFWLCLCKANARGSFQNDQKAVRIELYNCHSQ